MISGDADHRELMREVCGYDNKTTSNIAATYAHLVERAKLARPKECDNAMTRVEREFCINSLSFLARDLSFQQLELLGVKMGRRLYESVKSFALSGDPIFTTPAENYWQEKGAMCRRNTKCLG